MPTEPEAAFLYTDGTPVRNGVCVPGIDHTLTTFTIQIRSSGGVDKDAILNLLQSRHEVTDLRVTGKTHYVRKP